MNASHTNSRFAVYLIPPYEVARAVAEIHTILRKQFGLIAADQFQVHATIKGFFKKVDGPVAPLTECLNNVFATQRPFPVHFCGLRRDPMGVGLDIARMGEGANLEMLALHERVVQAVQPFVAPDCDFSEEEKRYPFKAHITLAFRDFAPLLQDQVLDYLQDATLPSEPFIADTFHFLEFFSQDWDGDWAPTLAWRPQKTWRV